jgi:hypothetical protein
VISALLSACSTLHLKASTSSEAVAACIAEQWRHCGASGFSVPVVKERTDAGFFVGIATAGINALPSGAKHAGYSVWAEITDTESGSATEYHKAYQFTSGCIDKVVRECQEVAPGRGRQTH